MSKRKRYVYPTDEIAHIWANAHESQGQARNPQGNFYFVGPSIYSYGPHFEIARHYKGVVLLTTREYSVTTASHIRAVWWSVRNREVLKVATFPAYGDFTRNEHQTNIAHFIEEIVRFTGKLLRARKRSYEEEIMEAHGALRLYVDRFRCKGALTASARRFYETEDFTLIARLVPGIENKALVYAAARRKEQRQLTQRRKQERLEALGLWVEGAQTRHVFFDLPTRLRVNGDSLETSHGARVPLEECYRVLRYSQRVQAQGTAWEPTGPVSIGIYRLNRINADGSIRVGCHDIAWPELERIGKELGWITT